MRFVKGKFDMTKNYDKVREFIDEIKIIDTHEHLIEEKERLNLNLDFGVLLGHYTLDSLIVAGLKKEDADFITAEGNDIDEKWKRIAPFWEYAKYNGYSRAFMLSMDKIYGIKNLNEKTYKILSDRIKEKNKQGILKYLIREISGIERCIVTWCGSNIKYFQADTDKELFLQELIIPYQYKSEQLPFSKIEEFTGLSFDSFDGYMKWFDWFFEKYGTETVSIKIGAAYYRSLYFEEVDKTLASLAFDRYLKDRDNCSLEDVITFQNYITHYVIQRSIDFNLPIRFHTGLLGGTNFMRVEDINPILLTNLFRKYPEVNFSLFHIGYPYYNETLAIAKHYSNVFIDLCWAWICDSAATKEFFKRFVLTTPVNKLFGFGGDFIHADLIYGHWAIAKKLIAEALAELVNEEVIKEEDAFFIAKRILRDNAIEFFKLDVS